MVLADLGATVIKVEQLTGDSTRQNPPYFLGKDSAYFLAVNRNKRSIAINMRSPGGRELIDRLLGRCDVVLDNLRAPQRADLGLSFERIVSINPRIISCSVTGFGSDGPYADRPAYDIIVEAMAGVMSLTGPDEGPSVRAGVPIGDITAGLYAAIGILAGLASRDRTGSGRHIDISMLDCQVSLLSYLAQYYFIGNYVAGHQGRSHVSIPTYNTFKTKDGAEIVVAANTEEMWRSLCNILGRDDLLFNPDFRTNKERLAHRDVLIAILRAEFLKWAKDEIYEALLSRKVAAAPINSLEEALADPQVRHRQMVVKLAHESGEDFMTLGNAIKTDAGGVGEKFAAPPTLGQDTEQVMLDLGYDREQISSLADSGAVGLHRSS